MIENSFYRMTVRQPDALGLTRALSNQQRADLYYGNLTGDEKLEIIEHKIGMLQEKQKREEEAKGRPRLCEVI